MDIFNEIKNKTILKQKDFEAIDGPQYKIVENFDLEDLTKFGFTCIPQAKAYVYEVYAYKCDIPKPSLKLNNNESNVTKIKKILYWVSAEADRSFKICDKTIPLTEKAVSILEELLQNKILVKV